MIRIVQAQINSVVGDLKGNTDKIVSFISDARSNNADIIIFPELAITGYPPEDLLLKDHFIDENLKALKFISKQTKDILVIVGFVDKNKDKLFNSAAIVENGKIIKIYHKNELPNYGVFDERRYFQEGNDEDGIFVINKIKCAVNICEDIWKNDGVHFVQAKKGAKILFNISSSPYDYEKLKIREKLLIKRAKETNAFIVYTNLIGGQDELIFDGGSLIVSPLGKIIAAAKQFNEQLLITELDLKNTNKYKNNVAKRLTQAESIYSALVLGTKDYVCKNGFKKVLIGLSGGIDSALVAAVAVDALGKENVIGVSMPSKYSSAGTQSDAKKLAENLDIEFKEIPINSLVSAFDETFKDYFNGTKPNVAEENIQARIRGNILMGLSNKFGWLVLTTGNKSEMAVGYCTLYGDMCGGFAVIKDVPKTKVYELCEYRNGLGRPVIPESIIKRAPSAELKENQKDQDSLPDYELLDSLLEGYVEDHHSYSEMARKGHNMEAKRVIDLVNRSEYKRRQAPPGIKITSRAFGRDWRLPITNKYKEC